MTRCKRARAGCPRHSGRDARATSEGSASFSSRDSNRAAEAAQKLLGEGAFLLRRQLFESLQQGLGVAAHAPIIAGILTRDKGHQANPKPRLTPGQAAFQACRSDPALREQVAHQSLVFQGLCGLCMHNWACHPLSYPDFVAWDWKGRGRKSGFGIQESGKDQNYE